MQTIVRLDCPHCQQTVELPAADAKRGINCPQCFRFIKPLTIPTAPPPPAKPQPSFESNRIRQMAGWFTGAAIGAAGIAVIFFLYGILKLAALQDGYVGLVVAGIFSSLAVWLFLIAQIIYIRANTEK